MRVIYIKNNDTVSHTYAGQELTAGQYYLIEEIEMKKWQTDSTLLTDIGSGVAVVAKSNTGSDDIADVNEAIDYLKGTDQVFPLSNNLKHILVQLYKPEDSSFARATHDFCNKSTWFGSSVQVVDEVATDSGDGLTFTLSQQNVIDVKNGIINRQDLQQAYAITVKVNDVETTDYVMSNQNHKDGHVVFNSSQSGNTVKVTYWYATDSKWSIKPDANKTLIIEHSEVQFADDVNVTSPIRFEVWVDNPYENVVGHPLEGIPRIIGEAVQYNSIRDIINEANLGTGVIKKVGDLPTDILVFPFNYVTQKFLLSSMNAELVISTVGDTELGGSYGTATFYLISKDEI